ncbi:MAG: hypothetical protein EBS65_25805 [Betaproteobacteria bacterium]|nr:hypothetical protein [Betaproteobacteria bacterium]
MRALTLDAHGGLDQITFRSELPVPELASPLDVRVRLSAAALNRLDLFVVGGLPGHSSAPGWVLGADGTGRIDQCGAAVTGLHVGDRVVINPGISTCSESPTTSTTPRPRLSPWRR